MSTRHLAAADLPTADLIDIARRVAVSLDLDLVRTDALTLLGEVRVLRHNLVMARQLLANLLAAANAALAAADEGEPDPVTYLRDELGQADLDLSDEPIELWPTPLSEATLGWPEVSS